MKVGLIEYITVDNTFIKTPRVRLVPFNLGHLDDYFNFASQDDVGINAGWTKHKDKKQSRQKLKMLIKSKIVFAIEEKTSSKVIGSFTISKQTIENNEDGIEFGFTLSKDYWGLGIMSELVEAAICFVFTKTTAEAIYVEHMINNERSRRLIEKNNFSYYKDSTYVSQGFDNIPTKCYKLSKTDYFEK